MTLGEPEEELCANARALGLDEGAAAYPRSLGAGAIAAAAETEMRRLAQSNGWAIHRLPIQPDHVHLFLSVPPAVAPSQIANTLKGASVHRSHPAWLPVGASGLHP